MSRKICYFNGTAQWAKVQEPSEKYESKDKEYSIDLYLDKDILKLFKESGLKLKVKEDERFCRKTN